MLKRLKKGFIKIFNNPQKILQYVSRYGKICEFHIRRICGRNQSFIKYLPQYGAKMNLRFKDSISIELFLGKFERDVCAFIGKFLMPGMVFFDVGANVGLYTLMASKLVGPSGQVHAFEPAPIEFKYMVGNIKLNKLKNVYANKIGISNHSSNAIPYYICPNGMGAFNSLRRPSHPYVKNLNPDVITVKSMTLDDYVKYHQIRKVDLIKIDIEGAELLALEGAKRLISKDDAPIIICEVSDLTTAAYGISARMILDWLKKHGFETYEINPEFGSIVPVQEKEKYIYSNIIASKSNNSVALEQLVIG